MVYRLRAQRIVMAMAMVRVAMVMAMVRLVRMVLEKVIVM